MAENAKLVTQLPIKTTLAPTDQVVVVSNTANPQGGNASLITLKNLTGNSQAISVGQSDPANATALTITQGSIFFSNTFGYIAIANNITRRWAISSF